MVRFIAIFGFMSYILSCSNNLTNKELVLDLSYYNQYKKHLNNKEELLIYISNLTHERNLASDRASLDFQGISKVKDLYCNILKQDTLLLHPKPNLLEWNEDHEVYKDFQSLYELKNYKYYVQTIENSGYLITNIIYYKMVSHLTEDLKNNNVTVEKTMLILYIYNTLYYDYLESKSIISC